MSGLLRQFASAILPASIAALFSVLFWSAANQRRSARALRQARAKHAKRLGDRRSLACLDRIPKPRPAIAEQER